MNTSNQQTTLTQPQTPVVHPSTPVKTIEDNIRLLTESTTALRLEEFSKGFPFMISLSQTPHLYYYEYADGHIEVYTLGDGSKTPIQTLTGSEADAIRKQANIK